MSEAAAVAYHEAGHAVIARALGLEVISVTMTPLDLDYSAITYCQLATYFVIYADYATQLSAIEKDVIVKLAGPHAECRFRSLDFNAVTMMREAAWGCDLKEAKYLVKMSMELLPEDLRPEYDELFEEFSFKTEIMVNEHWSAIERVAHGLLKFSDLNQRGVDDLIAGHVPVVEGP
jgi:hypothetical protein